MFLKIIDQKDGKILFMIIVRNLSFSYGASVIFDAIGFTVGEKQKVGLVGANGSGKTTLFKLLAGKLTADSGKIQTQGTVEFVPQEIRNDIMLDGAKTVRDYINKESKKQDFELLKILAGLELKNISLDFPPAKLSGGQKTRLVIAKALVNEPDILLLDEPTNFLDAPGKRWVMDFLSGYPKILMLVSHDLSLLDQFIDKIFYFNTFSHKLDEYAGNYSKFFKLKAEKDALLKRTIDVEKKRIAQMKKGWEKVARFSSEKGVRQKMNLKRRIERAKESLPQAPTEIKKIRIRLPEPAWVGQLPIIARNLCKTYGENKVLDNVSLSLARGERIALIGVNGAGKSTFIKIIMELTTPDEGYVLKDEKANIGYYSQEFEQFDLEKTLLETLKEKCFLGESFLRGLLARFLFQGDKVYQQVGTLSGGEKTRLSIALLLAQNHNVLILDEPTTYLDPLSQRIILEALKDYQGAMIIVSHTPEFIEELNPTRKLYLPENRIEICREN